MIATASPGCTVTSLRTHPNCGMGPLEPIATILNLDVIARTLYAIGLRSRAPPP
jgi:hypothetical protein